MFQSRPKASSMSMMEMAVDSPMLDPAMYNNMNVDQFQPGLPMEMSSLMNGGASTAQQLTENGGVEPGNSSNNNTTTTTTTTTNNTNGGNGISVSGVGAGPLPTEFGTSTLYQPSSTLTDFTKRRNWSQRLLEEIKDLLYVLTPDGRLSYLSPSTKALTGYEPEQLAGKYIFDYIHPDDASLFIREFNESIVTGNPLRLFYRFRTAENVYTVFECHGHPHLTKNVSPLEAASGPINGAGFCRGFFMIARPCQTPNSKLLDSFLEHKLENVRLQARIAALKREEADEVEQTTKHFHKMAGGSASFSQTESSTGFGGGAASVSQASRGGRSNDSHGGMPPPPTKGTKSNIALTREALDEANAFARPDSITDKMARYEGASHVDSIEMLTGLRYREGERSHGISTGGSSPALIRGDAGIDIPLEKADSRYSSTSYVDRKPKKVKSADEFVCTDCGTLDSPEWRRGPNGPKTLCNACGLRWAKKEKSKGGTNSNSTNTNPGNGEGSLMKGVARSGSGHVKLTPSTSELTSALATTPSANSNHDTSSTTTPTYNNTNNSHSHGHSNSNSNSGVPIKPDVNGSVSIPWSSWPPPSQI